MASPGAWTSNPTWFGAFWSPRYKPSGAAAQHNLEEGSTFTKMDGTDALQIDTAELLHLLKRKTTIAVELGPVIQNIGDHRAAHYYPQGMN